MSKYKAYDLMDNSDVERVSSSKDEIPPLEDGSDVDIEDSCMEICWLLAMLLIYSLRRMVMSYNVSTLFILGVMLTTRYVT